MHNRPLCCKVSVGSYPGQSAYLTRGDVWMCVCVCAWMFVCNYLFALASAFGQSRYILRVGRDILAKLP